MSSASRGTTLQLRRPLAHQHHKGSIVTPAFKLSTARIERTASPRPGAASSGRMASSAPQDPGEATRGMNGASPPSSGPIPSRSHYYLSRQELVRGVANRFVFSQAYIYLYLSMAVLSITTVVLSLISDCPTLPFYILEIIVNSTMILEVSIRFIAFGKQFWKSPFNWLDLFITVFCVITVLVIFLSGCSAKGEELFDTFLLVIRNIIQFSRLALMLRHSGKNIFSRIPPINLEDAAHDPTFALDLDLDDEEALLESRRADGGDMGARAQRAKRGDGAPRGTPDDRRNGATQPFMQASDDEDGPV